MSTEPLELDVLKQEYLSQLKGVFPLHRAALLSIVLLVVLISKDAALPSASTTIISLEIRNVLDFDDGILAMTTVGDLLISTGILLLGTVLQRALRTSMFRHIKKHSSLEDVAKRMQERSSQHGDSSVGDYFSLKKAEGDAKMWGKRVATMSLVSEGAATLVLTFVYSALLLGGWFDYVVAAALLVVTGGTLVRSFMIFLRHYLPHLMHQKGLAGHPGNVALP